MPPSQDRDRRWHLPRLLSPELLAIAALAIVVRLVPVLSGGGLGSFGRYDDGVYYAASDALIHGRVPYRQFVLLHPPGLMLFLTPFTWLGSLTSDPLGMATARLAFMAIGGLNAVLVAALALRWGRRPAIAAGVLYACWLPAVYSEQSTLLEPLAGTFILIALLLVVRRWPDATWRAELLAGMALGVACATKIWYAAPLLAVIGCVLLAKRFAGALRIAAGAAVSITAICLPFFVLAPTAMWNMVVRDQLLRQQPGAGRIQRLNDIVGVQTFFKSQPNVMHVLTVVILGLLAVAAVACLRDRRARVIAAVLIVNMIVLLVGKPYFAHYAALTAAPAALVLGVGMGKLVARPRWQAAATPILVVALAVSLASAVRIVSTGQGKRFPTQMFNAVAPPGCITADDPEALIQMNRLSSDLAAGCQLPVDVTGISYDTLRRLDPSGLAAPRDHNAAFQTYLYDYLTAGSGFVILRQHNDASPATVRAALASYPLLAARRTVVMRQGRG